MNEEEIRAKWRIYSVIHFRIEVVVVAASHYLDTINDSRALSSGL